jgi:hypothetical protein
LGFWSLEAEPGALVIVISFREYLKSIFQVHFEAGAWIGEYKGHAQLYSWNFTIKRFTRRCRCGLPNRPHWVAAGLDAPGESQMPANEDPCSTHYAPRLAPPRTSQAPRGNDAASLEAALAIGAE